LQPDDLALAVGMSEYLSKSVVRKRFLCAIRMFDAQHFTRGFKLKLGGLTKRIGDGNRLQALVLSASGAFQRSPYTSQPVRDCYPGSFFFV
jgi:hypothetical protein